MSAEQFIEALEAYFIEDAKRYSRPSNNEWANEWRDERESDNYRMSHPYESPNECVRDTGYVNSFDY